MAEDSFIFYDSKEQFHQIHGIFDFIRTQANGDPQAERWLGLMDSIINDLDAIDCITTVEYTEENRICYETLGKIQEGAEDKLLVKLLGKGEAFDNWESWVPEDAESYSLSTGANLHVLYEYVEKLIDERIPEGKEGWQKFQAMQDQIDFHLDDDLLQSFSGECVSVTLPPADEYSGPQSVTALRCTNPERIQELVCRVWDLAEQQPMVASQQVKVLDSDKLEGFHVLTAPMLDMFKVRPVMGFPRRLDDHRQQQRRR